MSAILPKNELENVNRCPNLLGQKFFVLFLGKLEKTKRPFEINWPLADNIHHYEGMTIRVILSFFHCLVSRQTPENQGIQTVSIYEFCLQYNWMNWDWSLGKNSALIWQQTTKSNVPPGCYVKLCKHEYLGYLILPAEINTHVVCT